MNDKPLVNKKYLLEKFPGKVGWTYTIIPEILPDKNAPFGWVKVKGSIDGYEINNYHLLIFQTDFFGLGIFSITNRFPCLS